MAKKKTRKKKSNKIVCATNVHKHGTTGALYFMGFIGAAVYYIMTATGFWNGVIGVLKALVWPAFIVYELMKFLGM